jgi:16S rRNA (guanine(966)-N(2))-methyltransferase RsmD
MSARRAATPGAAPGAAGAPGEVRLIGGRWKRSKLPVVDRPGLRPTPSRVRETLFNWLGQDLGGWRVLDAFAGSGALGFEAASRGAAEVQLIERDEAQARALRATRERLHAGGVQVSCADAMAWMARCEPGRFDLVLLDPPFDAGLGEQALRLGAPLVAAGGFLYFESATPLATPPQGFALWRSMQTGVVRAQLLRRPE